MNNDEFIKTLNRETGSGSPVVPVGSPLWNFEVLDKLVQSMISSSEVVY